jgi:hypothetical protein
MDGAGPTVFERIEQKLSAMGVHVDNSDIGEALKQVDASLSSNPADVESKLARIELKVVELARMLDATLGIIEGGHGGNGSTIIAPVTSSPAQAAASQPKPQAAGRKIKKLLQNPATGVIEEVEIDDNPADHFIVADGRARFSGKGGDVPGSQQHKKSVFIAASDDEPVTSSKK